MDFSSAREWLEMAEINAVAYARELIAKGRSSEAIMRAMEMQGIGKTTAYQAIWRARKKPHAKPMAPVGTVTGKALTVRLPDESIETLREAAAKRGVSPHKLACSIMSIVIDDGMIDAVLDDQT